MKKRFTIVFVLATVLILASFVSASNPWEGIFGTANSNIEDITNDGIQIEWSINPTQENFNDLLIPNNYYGDLSGIAKERASIELKAVAYIPTFVRLELKGNGGKSTVRAFGPDGVAQAVFGNDLIFDNEIGGFVDENWNSLGQGRNLEVTPETGKYIQASDYLTASIFSNHGYKYVVESDLLIKETGEISPSVITILPLQMSYAIVNESNSISWSEIKTFDFNNRSFTIAEKPALSATQVLHRFRVPYDDTVAAGKYEGKISFKVYTL